MPKVSAACDRGKNNVTKIMNPPGSLTVVRDREGDLAMHQFIRIDTH